MWLLGMHIDLASVLLSLLPDLRHVAWCNSVKRHGLPHARPTNSAGLCSPGESILVQPKMIAFWPKVVCPVADGDVIFDVALSDMDRVAEKSI